MVSTEYDREVCTMQDAETVLNVISKRGERGLPLENIYRLLYNRNLYLRAYGRLYSNQGAMTKGTTAETVDGMSLAKIDRIINELRCERFRWTPVRRVNIPKPNGKTRPLGIPTWTDKLLQEVIRMILEAYYEPQFSDHSHGFRPGRGCHTALSEVATTWKGTHWFVEGDIKGCFDNIDHEVLLSLLGEKLHDNRFLRLLKYLLKAGYLEEWRYGRTLSGTPQGGVVSPIRANIYLDRLDKYVETVLIPAHTRGKARRRNPAWRALNGRSRYHGRQGHHAQALELRKQMQQLPSGDPYDPGYRRLRYVRYADDFVLGLIGPKAEAEQIRESLETFLRDTLKLELSREKTLITHATSQAAKFLGYELINQQANDKHDHRGRRSVNGQIGLRVPAKVIEQHCQAFMVNGKPVHRTDLIHDSDYTIVDKYQAEFRGVVQYYLLAQNVSFFGRLQWVLQQSLAKTLANKHKTPRRKLIRRYMSTVQTEHGQRACLQVVVQRGNGKRPLVAQFGGIPLKRNRQAVLVDQQPQRYRFNRNELIQRLLADECEMCGSTEDIHPDSPPPSFPRRREPIPGGVHFNNLGKQSITLAVHIRWGIWVQVHHIRALRDLNVKGQGEKPQWIQVMAARRRKTLVVCRPCHLTVHGGTWHPRKQK